MSFFKQHELGIIGLGLLRNWLIGKHDVSINILNELKSVSNQDNLGSEMNIRPLDIISGYQKWSKIYDKVPNLLIDVEEPIVKNLILSLQKGKALDAACGTGRYSKFLQSLGYLVTGIDISDDMLNVARINNPDIDFIKASLIDMPIKNSTFDLTISALALSHLPKIDKAIVELARVTKVGGQIIISDIHPWIVTLGGQADFFDTDNNYGYVRNYVHWHSDYFNTFRENGLIVQECLEPMIGNDQINLIKVGFNLKKETIKSAFGDLPLALVWKLKKI